MAQKKTIDQLRAELEVAERDLQSLLARGVLGETLEHARIARSAARVALRTVTHPPRQHGLPPMLAAAGWSPPYLP